MLVTPWRGTHLRYAERSMHACDTRLANRGRRPLRRRAHQSKALQLHRKSSWAEVRGREDNFWYSVGQTLDCTYIRSYRKRDLPVLRGGESYSHIPVIGTREVRFGGLVGQINGGLGWENLGMRRVGGYRATVLGSPTRG